MSDGRSSWQRGRRAGPQGDRTFPRREQEVSVAGQTKLPYFPSEERLAVATQREERKRAVGR